MKKQKFASGAQRDTQDGKLRYELIPIAALKAIAKVYTDGAAKYGDHNYQKGIPFMRVAASALRHYIAWMEGDTSERHLANATWNLMAILYYEDEIAAGRLPDTLDDRPCNCKGKCIRSTCERNKP
jgi:hypothetical protein